MPIILTIIPAHNEEKLITYSALSVLSQKLERKYKIILFMVDDSSTDRTYQKMIQIANMHPNVYVLRIERRKRGYSTSFGAVIAIRAGIYYAEKVIGVDWDYLMLLDADTIIENYYVAKIVNVMESNRSIGIAGGVSLNEVHPPVYVKGTGMVIRREVWKVTGGLKGEPAPDTFIQLRAIEQGWKIAIVRSAKMWILRRTGIREKKSRCLSMGLADGIMNTSFYYSLIRSIKLAIGHLSIKCFINYFCGVIRGKSRLFAKQHKQYSNARKSYEALRIRKLISS